MAAVELQQVNEVVFQNYALYPHMAVAENIGFALKLRELDPDTETAIWS